MIGSIIEEKKKVRMIMGKFDEPVVINTRVQKIVHNLILSLVLPKNSCPFDMNATTDFAFFQLKLLLITSYYHYSITTNLLATICENILPKPIKDCIFNTSREY